MAAISGLGPGGYPRPPYGSFTSKPAFRSGRFSVLGPGGYPRSPYASFAGKPLFSGKTQPLCSVLGPGGYPRPPYGSFAGKPASSTGGGTLPHSKPFLAHPALLTTIPGEQATSAPAVGFLVGLAGYSVATLNMLPWTASAAFTDFTNAQWSFTNASATGGIASPDGNHNAAHLTESSSSGQHSVVAQNLPLLEGMAPIPFRFSAIAKAAERTRMVMGWAPQEEITNGQATVGFDLAGGNVGYDNSVGSSAAISNAAMTSLGGGWWLCQFDYLYSLSGARFGVSFTAFSQIQIDAGSGTAVRDVSYTGNGTSGIDLFWFNIMPVQAWSMTNRVFFDDFEDLSTIDVNDTRAPGFNWYVHNLFPNTSVPTFGWSTAPPSDPTPAAYLSISSPSVLKIYNPNSNATGLTSQIWSVATDGANGFVGHVFGPPMMYDSSISIDNNWVNGSPPYSNWGNHPSFEGYCIEALTNNGLNPSTHFGEWDIMESGLDNVSGSVHDFSNRGNALINVDNPMATGGHTGAYATPNFHRVSSLWINTAANPSGWGAFLWFFDGQFATSVQSGMGAYNASAQAYPFLHSNSVGLGSQLDNLHFTLSYNTGENVTNAAQGGWPMYIDWCRVYTYPTPPLIYSVWDIFDQPINVVPGGSGGSQTFVGQMVLSGNGLILTKTSADTAWDMIRARDGKGAGKWYWEITISGTVATSTSLILGLVNQAASTLASGTFPGSSASGAGAQHGSNWNANVDGVTGAFSGTVAFAANDVFGFAFDADGGNVYIHRNGTWINGPPSGGSGNAVWTGLTTASPGIAAAGWYPAAAIHDTGCTVTANFGTSPLVYSVPTGYFAGLFAGSGGGIPPTNNYVAEDGDTFYVAEDGTTFYVQES